MFADFLQSCSGTVQPRWTFFGSLVDACIPADTTCVNHVVDTLEFLTTLMKQAQVPLAMIAQTKAACASGCLKTAQPAIDAYFSKLPQASSACQQWPNSELSSVGLLPRIFDFVCINRTSICAQDVTQVLATAQLLGDFWRMDGQFAWPSGDEAMGQVCLGLQGLDCCTASWIELMQAVFATACRMTEARLVAQLPMRCSALGYPLPTAVCPDLNTSSALQAYTSSWVSAWLPSAPGVSSRCGAQDSPPLGSSCSAGEQDEIQTGTCFENACDVACVVAQLANMKTPDSSFAPVGRVGVNNKVWAVLVASTISGICFLCLCMYYVRFKLSAKRTYHEEREMYRVRQASAGTGTTKGGNRTPKSSQDQIAATPPTVLPLAHQSQADSKA